MSEDSIKNVTDVASGDANAVNPVPIGAIITFGGSDVPEGCLLCNGQSLTAYPDLAGVLGSNEAPDLRSRFVVGSGQGNGLSNYPLNQKGGVETVTLLSDQIPSQTLWVW